MTVVQFEAFTQAVKGYVHGLKSTAWAHKGSINALPDAEAVIAYDISVDWP